MAVHGPDSGYSWVIVVCSGYIHFALFGLFRSAGVMYVAVLQNYDVTREEASWPFALCAAVFQLVGPGASILTYYMSQRKVCLLGSAIATFGIAACYFADSVGWINIFYGLVHGLGFGLLVTVIPVTLNQYFVKYRATAMGIAFSGGTISSLIFPIIMEWLLENYTLKDSFLLLSGVVMNTLVAASLLRAPPWLEDSKSKLLNVDPEAKYSGVSTSEDMKIDLKRSGIPTAYSLIDSEGDVELKEQSIVDGNFKKDRTFYEIADSNAESKHDLSASRPKENYIDNANHDTRCSNKGNVQFEASDDKLNPIHKLENNFDCNKLNRNETEINEPLMGGKQIRIIPKNTAEKFEEKHKSENGVRHSIVDILKQPIFHLLAFTMCIYFLAVHSFFMVIVDFAKDKGIPEAKGMYIISMFSLTDLFGRACLGWVTDRNFVGRKIMVAFNLGVLGVLYQLYPLIDSLSGILVISAINGLAVGSSITLFFVLQAECLGMNRLTLVVGLTSFINGVTSLLRPGVIGLFRDVIGSYNWMFHFVGFICLVFSIMWLIESWRSKKNPKQVHGGSVILKPVL